MSSDVGNSKDGAFKYSRDRVWNKVKGWMEKLLSAGGKDVLIKSIAQAVPVFYVLFQIAMWLVPIHQYTNSQVLTGEQRRREENNTGFLGCHDKTECSYGV